MNAQSRFYPWTYNNPSLTAPEVQDVFRTHAASYLVFQEEVGEGDDVNVGTRHFQGYVEFPIRTRWRQINIDLPEGDNIHFEMRRGTQEQNIAYCRKERSRTDGPWVMGVPTIVRERQRTDIADLVLAVRGGQRFRQLSTELPTQLSRNLKFYDRLVALERPVPRGTPPSVILLHGPTGCGKSRFVFDKYGRNPSFYVSPVSNGQFWMDGYDGHKFALFDDFAGAASKLTLSQLLRILDRYPVMVPYKGGFHWWFPHKIWITTNIHPREWYKWERREEQYQALFRRFTKIKIGADLTTVHPDRIEDYKQMRLGAGTEDVTDERNMDIPME